MIFFFFFEEENLGVFFEKAASSFDGNIINSGMAGKSSQNITSGPGFPSVWSEIYS